MSIDVENLVAYFEMGFTVDNICASFAVTEKELDEVCVKVHHEGARDLAQRVRAAGPIHLLTLAYRAAVNDNRVLLYLLDRLWKQDGADSKKTNLSTLTDDQLAQIHKIVRSSMA